MIHLVIADNRTFRTGRISEIIAQFESSEVVSVDDAITALAELEQYLYPSLFAVEVPIVHGRFMLEGEEIEMQFIKKMVASPTVFVFEELSLPAATVTLFKKAGAAVSSGEKEKSKKPQDDIFAATLCLTAKDKKSRWLAYRSAMEKQPIEAILGILYWKVRSLASKGAPGNSYEKLYREMLEAQARAWRTGVPLEALIEKVILMQ